MPGAPTRLTAEARWRRRCRRFGRTMLDTVCDPPRRCDRRLDFQPAGVSNFLPPGDTQAVRLMRTVGLNIAIPSSTSRPGLHHDRGDRADDHPFQRDLCGETPQRRRAEHRVRRQRPVSVDEFSGYDRVEGGVRANVGVQATTQFGRGGPSRAVRQSYQLFGMNSYAVADLTNTGVASACRMAADYVARVDYSPNRTCTLARARAWKKNPHYRWFRGRRPRSFDAGSRPDVRRLRRAAATRLPDASRGIARHRMIKVAANWVVTGKTHSDLEASKVDR